MCMNDIIYFIDNYYDKAIELKERFKVTEDKKWDSLTVISELNVQFGHLTYLLSDYKEYGEKNRNIHNVGDELSDVLLQIFALCNKCKINIREYKNRYNFNILSLIILILVY